MKKLIIAIASVFSMIIFSFIPTQCGLSQDTAKIEFPIDTLTKHDTKTDKNIDTTNALVSEIKNKLIAPKIIYRTKTKVVHVPVKVAIHDTVYIKDVRIKYVPTVSAKEAQRLNKWYTDSLAKLKKEIDGLTPKKKKHKFLIF